MYIDLTWIILGAAAIAWVAYKVGYDKGNKDYDIEIATMEKNGDVVFTRRDYDDYDE